MKGDCFETLLFYRDLPEGGLAEWEQMLAGHLSDAAFEIIEKDHEVLLNIKSRESLKDPLKGMTNFGKQLIWKAEVGPVMPVISHFNPDLPFTTVDGMLDLDEKEHLSLSELATRYECARTGLDAATILNKMEELVLIVRNSIEEGLKGTTYQDRILGTQSNLIIQAEKNGVIKKSVNNSIIAFTSAIMEVKSSMGLIVAAPTAGSCGVVGGAIFGSLENLDGDMNRIVRAFLAAGITGLFIADKYTFSAEEGGCQVETGSGAAMAAAGLVELSGGTAQQAMAAASMALQNQLGLVCDPIAVRVEVPCLGKNIMAATNALNSSIMAMAGYNPLIPYDEVIDALKSVGESLPSSLCCTGLGGLAQTPTGKCLHKKFL
jgi:L-serine dehydratase